MLMDKTVYPNKTSDMRKIHNSLFCRAVWRKGLVIIPHLLFPHYHVSSPLSLSHLFQFVMLYFSLKRACLLVSGLI